MPSLRLLAVNADTLPVDRHGAARLIAELQPDVAVVHGAPSLLRWRSACAALAREAGRVVVAGGRTGGGNLLLSSLGVDVEATRELAFSGRRGPRPPGAAVAALRLLGAPFVLGGARQLGAPSERARQSVELLAALDEVSLQRPPAIVSVAGLRPGSVAADALASGFTALPGGVFVHPTITVVDAHETRGGAVRAELTLAPVEAPETPEFPASPAR